MPLCAIQQENGVSSVRGRIDGLRTVSVNVVIVELAVLEIAVIRAESRGRQKVSQFVKQNKYSRALTSRSYT